MKKTPESRVSRPGVFWVGQDMTLSRTQSRTQKHVTLGWSTFTKSL